MDEAGALGTIFGVENDLNGWITPGIEDFACIYAFNCCHNYSFRLGCDDSA